MNEFWFDFNFLLDNVCMFLNLHFDFERGHLATIVSDL
jgi:hypothetical protein